MRYAHGYAVLYLLLFVVLSLAERQNHEQGVKTHFDDRRRIIIVMLTIGKHLVGHYYVSVDIQCDVSLRST
jgi:hypothetical protein